MGNPSKWDKIKVAFWRWLARLLPRDLVYFVLIRVEHDITADKWPGDEPGKDVTLNAAIGRWHALGFSDEQRGI